MKAAPQFACRKFARGAYWICDPGYVYPEGEWGKFCDTFAGNAGVFDHSDELFFAWSTAHGDGIYAVAGPKTGSVGVDSGTLAVIPHELIVKWGALKEITDFEKRGLAISIRTARNFTITEEDGDIFFLNYCVDTSGFLDGPEPE